MLNPANLPCLYADGQIAITLFSPVNPSGASETSPAAKISLILVFKYSFTIIPRLVFIFVFSQISRLGVTPAARITKSHFIFFLV